QATFFANRGAQSGYFAGHDGETTIVDKTGPIHGYNGDIFSSPSGPYSAVQVTLALPRPSLAIVVGTGGHLTTITDTSGLFADLDLDPNVNGSGQVAFHGIRRDGSEGVFVGKGGHITRIADTAESFSFFLDSPAINDKGQVLFQAGFTDETGGQALGLFQSSEGKTRLVLDSNGAYRDFGFSFSSTPALNSNGQIAFLGTLQSGHAGIFTGADPVRDRVIGEGDVLDGSTVSQFLPDSFRSGLNNKGQIVFFVRLEDGRTGVYRADPVRHDHGDR
ncbi:MAG: hypothetical protein JWN14_4418, partial [Chthonomonadales bacterium]|nr:hypothetical protein [Chthonomonadales bacterium]